MMESSPKGSKTLREKEKLLDTSNFSFSLSVFKRLVLHTHKNKGLFGKGLKKKPSEDIWEKEKMLVTTIISTLSEGKKYTIFVTLKLWSANAFNLDNAKILSSCKGLWQYFFTLFQTIPCFDYPDQEGF